MYGGAITGSGPNMGCWWSALLTCLPPALSLSKIGFFVSPLISIISASLSSLSQSVLGLSLSEAQPAKSLMRARVNTQLSMITATSAAHCHGGDDDGDGDHVNDDGDNDNDDDTNSQKLQPTITKLERKPNISKISAEYRLEYHWPKDEY